RNRAEPLEQRRRLLLVVDLLDEEDARDRSGPLVDSDRILPLQQRIDVLFQCEPEDALDLAELRVEAWDALPDEPQDRPQRRIEMRRGNVEQSAARDVVRQRRAERSGIRSRVDEAVELDARAVALGLRPADDRPEVAD